MGVVQKYGGSSVATMEKIMAVALSVAEVKRAGSDIVVVASAMGKTTNHLISLAQYTGGADNAREMDALLATGEQTTISLLAMALNSLGIPAVSLSGAQCGFMTNSNHSRAKIMDININTLQKHLAEGKVVVVAGFQGIDEHGNVTTLGRGGSDTTAVALAAKLGWDCEIYTDVESIFTIDPRKCPGAKRIHRITYDEMMEMSALGAGVLETRSVEIAKKYGVRLYLGQALISDKTKGTYIMERDKSLETMPVTGISLTSNCAMLNINNAPADGSCVSNLFALAARLDVNVDMISQQILSDGSIALSFSCKPDNAILLRKTCIEAGLPYEIGIQNTLGKISLVGVGMITHSGIANRAFEVLFRNSIRYYQITTSEISISITVDSANMEKAARLLAQEFDLSEAE
ncbi:MAG: aspartate kinase [Clostridia bacterium]|nr:aspartate kinase [Candidatus Pelethousia sp.]NCB31198.1 aspartate kinase [Clostridia bacterium]